MIITWLQLVTMIVAIIISMIISMIVAVIITMLPLVQILFLVQRLVDMNGLVFVVNNLVHTTVGMWLHELLLDDNLLLERLLGLVNGLQDGLALGLHHRFNLMLGLHIHGLFHILAQVLVAMVVVVVAMVVVVVVMVVAINIVAVGFQHVPVLPVHHVLILDIHGHVFVHVTSLIMC